jgi:hypothetical protein
MREPPFSHFSSNWPLGKEVHKTKLHLLCLETYQAAENLKLYGSYVHFWPLVIGFKPILFNTNPFIPPNLVLEI